MTVKTILNFVAKTASNVYILNYVQQASLKTVGQYLGRLITKLPASPLIAGVAFSVLGDFVESKLFPVCFNKPTKIKITALILTRVALGAAIFVTGAALTGGTLVPAMIMGAKFGVLLLLTDKINKVAIIVLKGLTFFGLTLLIQPCVQKNERTTVNNMIAEYILPDKEGFMLISNPFKFFFYTQLTKQKD